MRTSKTVLLAVLALALIGSSAMAQRTPGSYSIGGFGGVGLPSGPKEFKDYFKSGIGYGGELKYNVNEKTSLSASFTMLKFGIKTDEIEDAVGEEGAKVTVEGGGLKANIIQANLLYYLAPPESSTQLYLIGGGGYYMEKAESPDKVTVEFEGETYDLSDMFESEDSESENDFGVQFGAGLDLPLGSLNLFVEGKYHIVFTEDESTKFITVMGGLRFPM